METGSFLNNMYDDIVEIGRALNTLVEDIAWAKGYLDSSETELIDLLAEAAGLLSGMANSGLGEVLNVIDDALSVMDETEAM